MAQIEGTVSQVIADGAGVGFRLETEAGPVDLRAGNPNVAGVVQSLVARGGAAGAMVTTDDASGDVIGVALGL